MGATWEPKYIFIEKQNDICKLNALFSNDDHPLHPIPTKGRRQKKTGFGGENWEFFPHNPFFSDDDPKPLNE